MAHIRYLIFIYLILMNLSYFIQANRTSAIFGFCRFIYLLVLLKSTFNLQFTWLWQVLNFLKKCLHNLTSLMMELHLKFQKNSALIFKSLTRKVQNHQIVIMMLVFGVFQLFQSVCMIAEFQHHQLNCKQKSTEFKIVYLQWT